MGIGLLEQTDIYKAYKGSPYLTMKHTTYFEVYEKLLAPYRGKNITFLEIGILNGGSLFMWREFLGPEARIIGMDLNPAAKKWEKDGFEIFIGSQSDEEFWAQTLKEIGMVDVVLDDGGHTYEQQIVTTECLLDHVKDGGMLVVEDTHTSYMKGFGPRKFSFIKYVNKHIDRINLRFSKFRSDASDTRVWSVQVFESIVVFHINRAASKLVSKPTNNGGQGEKAVDFRYFDNTVYQKHSGLGKYFKFVNFLPDSKGIKKTFWKIIIKFKGASNTKRFFK